MSLLTVNDPPTGLLHDQQAAPISNAPAARGRCVSHEEFQQALWRATFGLGAGLAFRYDGRRNETVWTLHGKPIGLTVGPIGATTACYLVA